MGVPDREYGQRLAAFLVLYPGERLDADMVREYVRRGMARFSVPRDVHFVAELPRNATGKVIRRYLNSGAPGRDPVQSPPGQGWPGPEQGRLAPEQGRLAPEQGRGRPGPDGFRPTPRRAGPDETVVLPRIE